MNITISNIQYVEPFDFEKVNTYGYFSLGEVNIESTSISWMDSYFGFRCICNVDDWDPFETYLFRVGFLNHFIVLSDFSKIPDIAVLESGEILKYLEIEVTEHVKKTTYKGNITNYLLSISEVTIPYHQCDPSNINYYTYGTSSISTLPTTSAQSN